MQTTTSDGSSSSNKPLTSGDAASVLSTLIDSSAHPAAADWPSTEQVGFLGLRSADIFLRAPSDACGTYVCVHDARREGEYGCRGPRQYAMHLLLHPRLFPAFAFTPLTLKGRESFGSG
jgi:hypothetical protein